MFSCKGFMMGLMTGAVMGSMMSMMMEPMKSKDTKKLRKSAGDLIHSVGDMVDGSQN